MRGICRFLVCFCAMLSVAQIKAQTYDGELTEKKKYELRPEFTARASFGFYNSDYSILGGVNINGKNTFGLMLGYHDTYYDAAPGNVYSINTSLWYRHYFHMGSNRRWAFYVDAYAGAGWVYKVDDNSLDLVTGERRSMIDESPGDVMPRLGLQPGISIRCYNTLHIFAGPSIATDCIGLHIGIGF